MIINKYITYGDYADNYCEDWAPTGTPALFTAGGLTFAPARMPGYPVYTMSWEQASDKSAGADTIAYAPYIQELLIQLPWAGMSGADKAALIAFFEVATVNGMAAKFSYFNPMIGPTLPVRFADGTLAAMPEIAYDRYKVDLVLRVDLNYPQMETSGTPPALTGNRFIVGAVAFPFPISLRPSTGYGVTKPQTLERNTAGSPVIYNKSRLTLQQHHLAMALDYDGFIRFLAFFFSFTHGSRKRFTWIDGDPVFVAEGTTNLIPLLNQQFVGWTTAYGGGDVVVLTQNQTVAEWGATDATRVQISSISTTIPYMFSMGVIPVFGAVGTWSLWVKNNGVNPLYVYAAINATPVSVLPGENKRVVIGIVGDGVSYDSLWFSSPGNLPLDFLAWRPQNEAKDHATPWTSSIRLDVYTQPTTRTVRLTDTKITIKQTAYNRYTTEINLVEEI